MQGNRDFALLAGRDSHRGIGSVPISDVSSLADISDAVAAVTERANPPFTIG